MISNLGRRAAILPFTRRGATRRTSYRDISSSKQKDLLDYCLRRKPLLLMDELLTISAVKHRSMSLSSTSTKESFSEIIAKMCVQTKETQIDFAFEMLECLNDHTPGSMSSGTTELLDRCVEYRHIQDAMKTYRRLRSMSLLLDTPQKDRLISALASSCRVSDMIEIISDHLITDTDLSVSAEPLIMSGKVITYSMFLNRFLDQKRNNHDPIQSPEAVARVIRSIMAARLKRYFDSSAPSEDENEGMVDILMTLEDYFMRLQCSDNSDYADILSSQSYFQNRQLCEMEKQRGLESNHNHGLSSRQLELVDHLPEFESTDFPYVAEGHGQLHIESIHRLRLRDLTTELKRKDSTNILLYSATIFPDTFEMMQSYLMQRSIVETMKKIMKQSGHFVDAVHEIEEKLPSYIKPTGHNGLIPPFILHDISYELKSGKPSLNLFFENDVFDRRHDVESNEIIATDILYKKTSNRPKSGNIPESNSDASSSNQSDTDSSNGLISQPVKEDEPEAK